LNIRRPKKKSNMLNDKRIKSCLSRFDSGAYSRLQFLRAVSHSVGAHTEFLQPRVDNSKQQQQKRGRRREQANFSGVGIGNSSRGDSLRRLSQSVHRVATCWLRTGAVRT